MVPVQLMEDLADEIKTILGHMRLPTPLHTESEINVFQYGLPVEKTNEDSKKKFPYVLITPQEGETGNGYDAQKVSVNLLIGLFDEDLNNQGKKSVLNIINDIEERFLKRPMMERGYYADEEIKWVVDTEDEYPYHYGAMWLSFNIPTFRRESEYA